MNFIVFCDGSTRGNSSGASFGACGFVITNEAKDVLLECEVKTKEDTTNQQMELEAATMAFQCLVSKLDYGKDDTATFYSDSKYLVDCYQKKWYEAWVKNNWKTSRRTQVQNQELWKQLVPIFERNDVSFEYVPAHQPDTFFQTELWWNNYVDRLVQSASLELKKKGGESE